MPLVLAAIWTASCWRFRPVPRLTLPNQRRESIALSPVERHRTPLLDEVHYDAALAEHLMAQSHTNPHPFLKQRQTVASDQAVHDFSKAQLAIALNDLWRKGLFAA